MIATLDIIRGNPSVGFGSSRTQSPTLPLPQELPSQDEIIADLTARLANVETIVEGKADANKIRTLIAFSDEAILIKAQDIVLAGDVTIAKIINEQNGTTSGEVPVSITRIIGDRIQTGSILSTNWGVSAGTAFDLDDGTLTIGGSSAPALLFDGTDLFVAGTITAGSVIVGGVEIDGTDASVVVANAGAGKSLSDALLISGTSVLKGVIQPTDTGAIKTGSVTWDSTTGALTGGTGVAITEFGIIGAASGVAKFTLNAATGDATFAGDITGASGTFEGAVEGTHLLATGSQIVSGYSNFAIAAIPGDFFAGGVFANSTSAEAARFQTSNGTACELEVFTAGGAGTGLKITNPTTGYSINVISGTSRFAGDVTIVAALTTNSLSTGAIGATDLTISGDLVMTDASGNLVIGNATNTGAANICIDEGAAGAKTAGQLQIYGAASTSSKTTLGVVLDEDIVSGTGPFSGIAQLKVLINAVEYWLPLNPV